MHAKRGESSKKSPSRSKRHTRQYKAGKHPRTDKRTVSAAPESRDKQKDARTAPKPIAGWRLWLFRTLAVTVIPALLFLLVELFLRIVGYGYPAAATIKCEVNGRVSYGDNVKFGWRFFPRNIAREFEPFIFAADKPDDTYRIFVLGASAAMGAPDPAFCFGRILRAMLRQQYSGVNFEVITAAMPAVNSHAVLEIAKDCGRHDADLFIVYMGNNEVVGPYGAGTVFAPLSGSLSLIRMGIALKTTRLGQLLTDLAESAGGDNAAPVVWGGLAMFLEKQIRADDPRLESVYRHFRRNLEAISRIARKSGARIIFCTVGSNLKGCPPFASLHRSDLADAEKKKWEQVYEQGVGYEAAGKYFDAVGCYLAAAEIDASYADLQFRLAHCYWAMGEYDKARDRYIKARELDTLRFRADTRMNKIIRVVGGDGAEEGVYLVDAVRAFEENSRFEIPGEELFYEHVHLNFDGNYLLAKTVFEQVEEILPESVKRRKAHKRSLLTVVECAQRLAYNNWVRYNIAYKVLNYYIKEPPFTNQLYHDEQVRQFERRLKALEVSLTPEALRSVEAQYRQLLKKDPSDIWLRWRYAELLSVRLRNELAAAEQCHLMQRLLPHSYKPHLLLGLSLGRLGRVDEAIDHLLRVTRIKPTSANAYHRLGSTYQAQARIDRAVKCYSAAVRLQPNNIEAYRNLAELLSQRGKVDEAAQACRKGLLLAPADVDLHYKLGILMEKRGRRNEAIKEFQTALHIDPNSAKTRNALNAVLRERNPALRKVGK